MVKFVITHCYYIGKLQVEGEIVGFLWPNGAGKTTTIKLILGILTPDEGEILIRNKNIKNRRVLINEFRNISSIVEAPGLYGYLTGFENLEQVARLDDRIKVSDINKLVEEVGLKNSIFNKVKTYSLGMKQKLALVQALITKPKLLILDEPTNGLDPLATVQIRELLKNESFVCDISSLKNKLLVTIKPDSSQEIIKVLTRNNIDRYHETLEEKYMEVYAK